MTNISRSIILTLAIASASNLFANINDDLITAVKKYKTSTINRLLKKGADVNATDENGKTPLIIAAEKNTKGYINYFLKRNADVDVKDDSGNSALHYLAKGPYYYYFRKAIARSKDINQKNADGNSVLMLACEKNRYSNVKELLKRSNLNFEVKNNQGKTAVQVALEAGYGYIANVLLGKGASFDLEDGEENNLLHLAAKKNDYKLIKVLLKKGVPLDKKNASGKTALILAAENKKATAINMLVDAKANADIKDNSGKTALHYIANSWYYNQTRKLAKAMKDIDTKDDEGRSAIFYAVLSNKYKNLYYINENKPNLNLEDNQGVSPIHLAFEKRKWSAVYFLAQKKANMNKVMKNGKTILGEVTSWNSVNLAKLFLENGANPNTNSDGKHPLVIAVDRDAQGITKMLIKAGANVDTVAPNGDPVITYAIEKNRYNIIYNLLQKKPNLDAKDSNGNSPLIRLVEKCRYWMLDMFLKAGAKLNIKNGSGKALILIAHENFMKAFNQYWSKMFIGLVNSGANVNLLTKNKKPIVSEFIEKGVDFYVTYLISKGAEVNVPEPNGNYPIHLAALKGKVKMLKAIIEKDSNIDRIGAGGNSALMNAAQNGHSYTVEFLIKKGANPNIINDKKETALNMALKKKSLKIVKSLLKSNIKLDNKNEYGNTLLIETAKVSSYSKSKNAINIFKLLIDGGANINEKNEYGNTALHYTINRKNPSTLKALLDLGANPDIKDSLGNTALHKVILAAQFSKLKNESLNEIMYILLDAGANINAKNNSGNTPLNYASEPGLSKDSGAVAQVTKILLAYSASIDIENNRGYTALENANKQDNYETIKSLEKYQDKSSDTDNLNINLKIPTNMKIVDIAEDNKQNYIFLIASETNSILAKYSSNGRRSWQKKIRFGKHITVDSTNNIYVGGRTLGTFYRGRKDRTCKNNDNYVVSLRKFNSYGKQMWSQTDGKYRSCSKTKVMDVKLAPDDVIYMTVTFGPQKNYIYGFDKSKKKKFSTRRYGIWTTMNIDSKGDAHLFGKYIHRINKYGKRKYTWKLRFPSNRKDVTFDSEGNYIAVGNIKPNKRKSIYVSKYSAKGSFFWQRQFGTNSGNELALRVFTDSSSNTYIAGTVKGSLHAQASFGGWDIFITKIDEKGNRLWTRVLGSSNDDSLDGINLMTNGNLILGISNESGSRLAKVSPSGIISKQ